MKGIEVKVGEMIDVALDKLIPLQGKLKTLSQENEEKLWLSIKEKGFSFPIFAYKEKDKFYVLDAHQRISVLKKKRAEGYKIPSLPTVLIKCKNLKDAKEKLLLLNSHYGEMNQEGFIEFAKDLDLENMDKLLSLPEIELDFGLDEDIEAAIKDYSGHTKLIDRFIIPPFSVLDTRQGYWQDRKRAWLQLGLKSEIGRDANLVFSKSAQGSAVYELKNRLRKELKREPTWDEVEKKAKEEGYHFDEGTSIFDPVLCEIMYKWFVSENGTILDPFAGGSVRGVIAAYLGYDYTGIDLRKEQVEANRLQAGEILQDKQHPNWIAGNSLNIATMIIEQRDFIFSCPPYFDLEVYSDDPGDISNLKWDEFKEQYKEIIKKSVALLKDNRFACFVVGDVRDKKGFYRNFVGLTKEAFIESGCQLYNELILVNVAGSLPIRAKKMFQAGRKVGKMHQNVLVFYKGDPKQIKENYREIEIEDVESNTGD